MTAAANPPLGLVAWPDFADRLPLKMTRRAFQALRPAPLASVKVGSRLLYSAAAVDAFIAKLEALASAPETST